MVERVTSTLTETLPQPHDGQSIKLARITPNAGNRPISRLSSVPENELKSLRKSLSGAKASAKRKGLAFTLSLDQLEDLYLQQNAVCALSGLPFHNEEFPDALVKRPFSLSIDRIDPKEGYTPENIQLVLVAVNFARNQWGDDVLRQISWGVANHEVAETQAWRKEIQKRIKSLEREVLVSPPSQQIALRRQISGLKATLTKGPSRLRGAARRASKRWK